MDKKYQASLDRLKHIDTKPEYSPYGRYPTNPEDEVQENYPEEVANLQELIDNYDKLLQRIQQTITTFDEILGGLK